MWPGLLRQKMCIVIAACMDSQRSSSSKQRDEKICAQAKFRLPACTRNGGHSYCAYMDGSVDTDKKVS